ncbi:MAG: hypothetical protein IPN69_08150 [Acidobacteria bacterium]|nr:hypothetical protein [Acidobacteriota bacterium]
MILCQASAISVLGQQSEPEFIGEAFVLKADESTISLDKEIGEFSEGMSWSANSWKALSLEVAGNKAKQRFIATEPLQLVVRAVDNNSDPLAIVSIYKLKSKKKSRTVLISKDNSGTLMKSRTNTKDLIRFTGKKFGTSSYLITLSDLAPGEYGIVVTNPNTRDEKRTVVSCFGLD